MSKEFERLSRIQAGSPKLHDPEFLSLARSLPPTDQRRKHYAALLAKEINALDEQKDRLEQFFAMLDADALRWTAPADA